MLSSNNVHEKITRFGLAENECILKSLECTVVARVQIANSARTVSKFCLS